MILDDLIAILQDMIAEWDLDLAEPIGPATTLVSDLGFSSIDLIHLIVAIEEHFARPKMGFNELLMKDGQYVADLTVGQLAEFVAARLHGSAQ